MISFFLVPQRYKTFPLIKGIRLYLTLDIVLASIIIISREINISYELSKKFTVYFLEKNEAIDFVPTQALEAAFCFAVGSAFLV